MTVYTKQQFGKELKEKIGKKIDVVDIGAWAVATYYDRISEIDPASGIRKILLTLGAMEEGPQFARSYEELDEIADRLIAGQDVTL